MKILLQIMIPTDLFGSFIIPLELCMILFYLFVFLRLCSENCKTKELFQWMIDLQNILANTNIK